MNSCRLTPHFALRAVLILTAWGLLLGVLGGPSKAGLIVLDQQNTVTDNASVIAGNFDEADEISQTFTVGIGGILSRVDVQVAKVGSTQPLLFDLRSTVSGAPREDDYNILVSRSVAAADIADIAGLPIPPGADFVSIDVSAARIAVVPDELLAITLRTAGTRQFRSTTNR